LIHPQPFLIMELRALLFPLAFMPLLFACRNEPGGTGDQRPLELEAARLRAEVAERDSAINQLFGSFNRISENLRTIRAKQGQLTDPSGTESGRDMEERIVGDIAEIDALLAENRELLERMRTQARSSANGIRELERTVLELERGLLEKNEEIDRLKEELSSSNSSLATLIQMYRDKAQQNEMQREMLGTVYYAVGTAKELRENGVLTREGGVAGMGRVDKLNTGSLPRGYFKRIDMYAEQEIPVAARKIALATSHPDGSYRFDADSGKLLITDAETFWSVSKYLVVVVE
jgi:hypothetical protein